MSSLTDSLFLIIALTINLSATENLFKNEIWEGSSAAKVKIFVYESLTCPHCADFHEKIYPLLKKDFIDTGLVQIYFKSFPLDLAGLNASKIVHCLNADSRLSFLHNLYKTQKKWVKGSTIDEINNNLEVSLNQFGINYLDQKKCFENKEIEDFILNGRIDAANKYKINSTPTLIINEKKFEKSLEYKNIKKAIEKLI